MPAWLTVHPGSWEMWACIGLVFIAFDMLLGYSGSLIAMGVAALVMALLAVVAGLTGLPLVSSWVAVILEYAALATGAVLLARWVIPKPSGTDVNDY